LSQTHWKYKNKSDKEYEVSIYHGDTSGHVLLYSGQEIIKIDFSVFSDRVYSFILGDELFELRVKIKEKSINYLLYNSDQNKIIHPFNGDNYPTYHIIKGIIFIIIVVITVIVLYRFI
jgi:hypothetical protein